MWITEEFEGRDYLFSATGLATTEEEELTSY